VTQSTQEVVVTTKNPASLTLGIVSVVIGVLALLSGWVPYLGLLAIPGAVIGGILAVLGLIIAALKKFRGAILPILGGAICTAAIILPVVSTHGTATAIRKTMDRASSENATHRDALEEQRLREQAIADSIKADYIANQLELYGVKAAYMESMLEGQVPGVLFKLRNRGSRSLNRVEVTVYFKDRTGATIAEESYLPVRVSEYSLSSDDKPLKPGYVWQMERGRFYSAKSVPTEWAEGSIDATITSIEFAESQ